MSSKDPNIHNPYARPANIRGGKPISSNNSLAFTSNLSSLISSSTNQPRSKPTSARLKPKKDDIFHKPTRHSAKRARLDLAGEESPTFSEQKHTTKGESLDRTLWERSQKKMQEKARLYAAMKRGDIEDVDEKYTVDFDRKWAQAEDEGKGSESEDLSEEDEETVEYTDEFGRTRTGTKSEAARVQRIANAKHDLESDRFSSRPSAPSNVIRGDTIQHAAWQPDAVIADQIEELARKRDKSLTPPPEEHFDARKEVRNHGTGFFQFSGESEERRRQMEELEKEREETERVRRDRGKRMADEFLEELGEELEGRKDDEGSGVKKKGS